MSSAQGRDPGEDARESLTLVNSLKGDRLIFVNGEDPLRGDHDVTNKE
jgi:hypothetical protein